MSLVVDTGSIVAKCGEAPRESPTSCIHVILDTWNSTYVSHFWNPVNVTLYL